MYHLYLLCRSARRQRTTAGSWLLMILIYAMARLASATVNVRGIPYRSASSLHGPGMRTRSSPYEAGASRIRAIVARTRGIARHFCLGRIPSKERLTGQGNLTCDASAYSTDIPLMTPIVDPTIAERAVSGNQVPFEPKQRRIGRTAHMRRPDPGRFRLIRARLFPLPRFFPSFRPLPPNH
jgi:hypothetical protein